MTLLALHRPLAVRADRSPDAARRRGLTLIEMLVAISITLLMMSAVVTVFSNVSGSVARRRATIEMASTLRTVRETLARDLAGATCPAVPTQRPEANQGYLEIIEGPQNDYYPSPYLWDGNDSDVLPDPIGQTPGIDLAISSLPGSNLRDPSTPDEEEGRGRALGSNVYLAEDSDIKTDGRALGDADDILMLTVRNEIEPFVGRIPSRVTNDAALNRPLRNWQTEDVTSQLAEVVWFSVENPVERPGAETFAFGEAGYRTIHRRALLILPELDYGIRVTTGGVTDQNVAIAEAAPKGTVRVLSPFITRDQVARALAALIAFQERFDLSVRLEWDSLLPATRRGRQATTPADGGRWIIRANTLADLTKRENRFEHHGFNPGPVTSPRLRGSDIDGADRAFPFAVASAGRYANGAAPVVEFVTDFETPPAALANGFNLLTVDGQGNNATGRGIGFDTQESANRGSYTHRPLAYALLPSDVPATVRALTNEDGAVTGLTFGLAPLGGARRGDDVMLTDALAFDLRVYDPGAPVYSYYLRGDLSDTASHVVTPGDPGWANAYQFDAGVGTIGDFLPTPSTNSPFLFERQGAYVDMGYRASFVNPANPGLIPQRFLRAGLSTWPPASLGGRNEPRFLLDGLIRTSLSPVTGAQLTTRYATYDTWSTHYESNGLNEDGDRPDGQLRTDVSEASAVDEGTNGLDDFAVYEDDTNLDGVPDANNNQLRFGADDPTERETRPPYDTALRGLQVTLRVYERDSRQVREATVRESFVPE